MRFTTVGLTVLTSVVVLSLSVAAASSMILFNDTGQEVYGLRVIFNQPVTITEMGMAFATWTVSDSESSILFQDGCLDAWGDFNFFWEPAEAAMLSHEWVMERPAVPFEEAPFPYWGFTLRGLGDPAGFNSAEICHSLDRLIATGANCVMIASPVHMGTCNSSHVEPADTRSSNRLSDISSAVRYLRDAGLDVTIRPTLAVDCFSATITPEDPSQWFKEYADVLISYARLAEETGATALLLTNEMESTLTNPDYVDEWMSIIERVRQVYTGEISATVTFDWYGIASVEDAALSEAMNIPSPIAGSLDYISISVFPRFTDKNDPTVSELVEAWYSNVDGLDAVEVLKRVYQQYGKPILLETGYRSVDGENKNPCLNRWSGSVDYAEQDDLFEALMRVLVRESCLRDGEWLRGVSVWPWLTCLDPAVQLLVRGYDPLFSDEGEVVQNKPAKALLAAWFHRFGGTTPPTANGEELGRPLVLFDSVHAQQVALTEEGAKAINAEHPEWCTLAGLAPYVTASHDVGRVSSDVLQGCDIYVIAAPGSSFSSTEVAALEEFVAEGGGLLLVGNAWAKQLALVPLGIAFDQYPVGELTHLHDFASFNLEHVVEHLVTRYTRTIRVNWSCTMTVGPGWQVLAETSEESWQERTGNDQSSASETRGPFPILAVRELGEGRIVAISDDRAFRKQGDPFLVQAILDWLAGE